MADDGTTYTRPADSLLVFGFLATSIKYYYVKGALQTVVISYPIRLREEIGSMLVREWGRESYRPDSNSSRWVGKTSTATFASIPPDALYLLIEGN